MVLVGGTVRCIGGQNGEEGRQDGRYRERRFRQAGLCRSYARGLHADGVTILLVEQNARLALQTADRAYVLEAGRLTIAGRAADLLTDERVRRAYLG